MSSKQAVSMEILLTFRNKSIELARDYWIDITVWCLRKWGGLVNPAGGASMEAESRQPSDENTANKRYQEVVNPTSGGSLWNLEG